MGFVAGKLGQRSHKTVKRKEERVKDGEVCGYRREVREVENAIADEEFILPRRR